MYKNSLKNSHPFGERCQKTEGGIFHTVYCVAGDVKPCSVNQSMLNVFVVIITANNGVWCMAASNLLNETGL